MNRKKKVNKNLMTVLIISALVHIVAFMILGSVVIFNAIVFSEPEFEAAVPPVPIEPEQLQVQRDMRQRAQDNSVTRAQPQQRITINTPTLSEVQSVNLTVAPPSSGVSLDGAVGSGLGGGGGLGALGGGGGIGVGRRSVSFLGVQSAGERVAILVDCSNYMMLDEKGGLYAFRLVKDECVKVIESLEPGVVFNIYLFSGSKNVNRFKPHMVTATPATINEIKAWLAPINEDPTKLGARVNNFKPDREYFSGSSQTYSNFSRALHAAFVDQAEAIFLIAATWSNVRKHFDDFHGAERRRMEADLAKRRAEWEKNHKEAREKWIETVYRPAAARAREILNAENARRKAAGRPPRIILHIDTIIAENKLIPPGPRPPAAPRLPFYTAEEIINRFRRELYKDFYRDKQKELPSINIILFGKNDKAEENFRQLARTSRSGNFRTIPSLAELEAAREQGRQQRNRP